MLNDRKLVALGLCAIPTLGAAVLLSTTAKTAQASCTNTHCLNVAMCDYQAGRNCALTSSSCTITYCC